MWCILANKNDFVMVVGIFHFLVVFNDILYVPNFLFSIFVGAEQNRKEQGCAYRHPDQRVRYFKREACCVGLSTIRRRRLCWHRPFVLVVIKKKERLNFLPCLFPTKFQDRSEIWMKRGYMSLGCRMLKPRTKRHINSDLLRATRSVVNAGLICLRGLEVAAQ